MPAARRVQLAPPAAWDEEKLLAAARALAASGKPVRPGDAVGELVVVAVEPEPGAALSDESEIEILPIGRRADAPQVEIAVLLDASESMMAPWDARHTRMEAAVEALTSFLKRPGPAVASMSVYHYAKEPRLVAGPDAPGAIKGVPAAVPKGRSGTGTALNAALADLAARTAEGRSQAVLLLTDGVGEVPELLAAAERAGRLRIPVHAVVFAPELDEVFEQLARATGGSVQKASYPLTIEFEHQPGGA